MVMTHYKCPTCKKIVPISDESKGEDAICMDCGTELVKLAPVKSAAGKGKDNPHPDSSSDSDESVLEISQDDEHRDEDRIKPKSKKRGSRKSKRKRDEDQGEEVPRPYGDSTVEGEDVLGRRKIVFTSGNNTLRIVAISCAVLTAVGLLSCILSLLADMPKGTYLIMLVSLIGGMAGLLWCMNSLTLKVAVHEGGIVHSHGARTQIIPWEEISSVTLTSAEENQKNGRATPVYTIDLRDHSQIIYTNKEIKDVEQLGNIIIEKTSALILPQVRLKYENGEKADFGRLCVNREGLRYGKNTLSWSEIKGVKVSEGYISVNKEGEWSRWSKINASSVPNLQVFLTLVNEIVRAFAD